MHAALYALVFALGLFAVWLYVRARLQRRKFVREYDRIERERARAESDFRSGKIGPNEYRQRAWARHSRASADADKQAKRMEGKGGRL